MRRITQLNSSYSIKFVQHELCVRLRRIMRHNFFFALNDEFNKDEYNCKLSKIYLIYGKLISTNKNISRQMLSYKQNGGTSMYRMQKSN